MAHADTDSCPHCGVTLVGEHIPQELHEFYSPPYYWRREIGIEIVGGYDGVAYWECPDCRKRWDRLSRTQIAAYEHCWSILDRALEEYRSKK